jgi:hypothetical protein
MVVATVDADASYYTTDLGTPRNLQSGLTDEVAGGLVTITFATPTDLMGHQYHLELFETPDITDPIPMTVGVVVACCIEFTTVHETAGEVTFSNAECPTSYYYYYATPPTIGVRVTPRGRIRHVRLDPKRFRSLPVNGR